MRDRNRAPLFRLLALAVAAALLGTGCATWIRWPSSVQTEVDKRIVYRVERDGVRITCAEPSPDVAKAVSEAFNLGGALDVAARGAELPAEGAARASLALSTARAEALAQLTNRLATIQLLRDGLYRACEAYANGALTKPSYAIITSRYDDIMVTLAEESTQQLNAKREALAGTRAALVDAERDLATCEAENRDNAREACQSRHDQIRKKRLEVGAAERALTDALVGAVGDTTAATSSAADATIAFGVGSPPARAATPGGSADAPKPSGSEAGPPAGHRNRYSRHEMIGRIQRKFIENINEDAVMVSCIVAMQEEAADGNGSAFVTWCDRYLELGLRGQRNLLRLKLLGSAIEHTVARCASEINKVQRTREDAPSAAAERVAAADSNEAPAAQVGSTRESGTRPTSLADCMNVTLAVWERIGVLSPDQSNEEARPTNSTDPAEPAEDDAGSQAASSPAPSPDTEDAETTPKGG